MPKKILKNKSRIIIAITIVAAFFFLHYSIYLDYLDGGSIPIIQPIIQGTTETPAEMKALTLCEEKLPGYFSPFQKATYTYCFNESSKIISEEAASYFFYSDMQPHSEKISDYWQGENVEGKMFMRSLAAIDFPSPIFFLIQYILLAAFIFNIYKIAKSR